MLIRKDALLYPARQIYIETKEREAAVQCQQYFYKDLRQLEDQKNAGKYRRPRLRYNIVQTGAATRTCEDLHIFCRNFWRKVDSQHTLVQ